MWLWAFERYEKICYTCIQNFVSGATTPHQWAPSSPSKVNKDFISLRATVTQDIAALSDVKYDEYRILRAFFDHSFGKDLYPEWMAPIINLKESDYIWGATFLNGDKALKEFANGVCDEENWRLRAGNVYFSSEHQEVLKRKKELWRSCSLKSILMSLKARSKRLLITTWRWVNLRIRMEEVAWKRRLSWAIWKRDSCIVKVSYSAVVNNGMTVWKGGKTLELIYPTCSRSVSFFCTVFVSYAT